MRLIIDIPEEDYNECKFRKDLLSLGGEPTDLTFNMRIETLIANGILLEEKKNGEVIKYLFPHIEIKDNCDMYYSVDIENLSIDKSLNTVGFKKDWWNAPYKEINNETNNRY